MVILSRSMSLNIRWVDEADYDRVAETRMYCYGANAREVERFRAGVRGDPLIGPGDLLLAERDGRAVGTATSLSLRMWVRGGVIPCQGVAWVGTVKTSRRTASGPGGGGGGAPREPGVATRIMHETIRHARDRGQVISALMPFRGSFYEHFGYGVMERRVAWTVPIGVFPHGPFDGLRFLEPGDLPELVACRQRVARSGQCDMERSLATAEWHLGQWDGMIVVDRPDDAGPVRGWMTLQRTLEPDGTTTLRVAECGHEDVPALKRQLHFLASLRDQYSRAVLTLPADVPLTRLLREPQITHRDVRNHPTPEARPYTRMQCRVLDHQRFLEALHLPPDVRGRVSVTVREAEGHATRLGLEIADGRVTVSDATGDAQFECRDTTWAAVATGDLTAADAVRYGLATASDASAASLLDVFSRGPLPFTHEYF
jgi:predicted acetyltransferase